MKLLVFQKSSVEREKLQKETSSRLVIFLLFFFKALSDFT